MSSGDTSTALSRAEIYGEQRLRAARAATPSPTPTWVNERAQRLLQDKLSCARQAQAEGQRWFLVEAAGGAGKRTDELRTAAVYLALVAELGLEGVPGYTAERRRAAVSWWQSWQNDRTGRFYNPAVTDPQQPRDPSGFCNEKYVVNILRALGAAPLHPFNTISSGEGEAGGVDLDVFYAQTCRLPGGGSWAGMMCVEMMKLIEAGNQQLVPVLARGIHNLLSRQLADTGLWSQSTDYAEYGTTSDALKINGRLHYHLGVAGLPHMRRLAETLVQHQAEMRRGAGLVLRNTGELMAICLETSGYLRDELLQALARHAEPFRRLPCEQYTVYGLGLIGAYLHWEDCGFSFPLRRCGRGAQWARRLVVQADLTIRMIDASSADTEPRVPAVDAS
jgi:hypothetical protein